MWRLALGLVLAVILLWMIFRRKSKSSYKPAEYKPEMNIEELSTEFNKTAGEMEAEIAKHISSTEAAVNNNPGICWASA